jgi:hypothetical protein
MVLNILSEWYLAENQRFGILEFFNRIGRKCQFAILPDDCQLYGVERLFNNRRFGNLELAESAKAVVHKNYQPTLLLIILAIVG